MRLPRWLGGGSKPEPEQDDERKRAPKDDSEEAERERLAKARRERARKARAELAAKARREKPERDGDRGARKRSRGEGGEHERRRAAKGERAKGRHREGVKDEQRAGAKGKRGGGMGPERAKGKRGEGAEDEHREGKREVGTRRLGASIGPALGRGAKAVRSRARKDGPRVARAVLHVILALFAIFFSLLAVVLNVAIALCAFAAGPVRAAIRRLHLLTNAASRAVTPARVLALVVAGAIVMLALSQFADYRTISIGNDSYTGGIQTVAPAPVAEADPTGSAHSYLMVPVAAAALLLLGAAMTGRWRLCRLIALAGIVAIVVGLLHDRPTGLDPGERAVAYEGVKATLIGGFYAQLAAGLLITVGSLLLGHELRASAATRPERSPWPSRPRRRRSRHRAPVEGARA